MYPNVFKAPQNLYQLLLTKVRQSQSTRRKQMQNLEISDQTENVYVTTSNRLQNGRLKMSTAKWQNISGPKKFITSDSILYR